MSRSSYDGNSNIGIVELHAVGCCNSQSVDLENLEDMIGRCENYIEWYFSQILFLD